MQLVYNPNRAGDERARDAAPSCDGPLDLRGENAAPRASETVSRSAAAPRFWSLYWPAFAALGVNAGAGCYALAHFISLGAWTGYLFAFLGFAVAVACGACSGDGKIGRFCRGARWLLVLLCLLLAMPNGFNSSVFFDNSDANAAVAFLVGIATVLSILLVGGRSGDRCIPISAPLVPALSLFGLLCLVCVDAEVQVCFAVFVASALYLLCYDRFLHLHAPALSLGIASRPTAQRASAPTFKSISSVDFAAASHAQKVAEKLLPTSRECHFWAKQSLWVSGLWFCLFMAGGALFYWPVQAILPRLIAPQFNSLRAATQGVLDYRNSGAVMELRGGDHPLSEREIMKITLHSGETSGLWRGRSYERYHRSRWEENGSAPGFSFSSKSYLARPPRFRRFGNFRRDVPRIPARLGRAVQVLEMVEPRAPSLPTIYASGVPLNWTARPDSVEPSGFDAYLAGITGKSSERNAAFDVFEPDEPYLISSYVIQPRWNILASMPGYETLGTPPGEEVQRNLQQPEDPATRKLLLAVTRQIEMGQRRPLRNPLDKMRAVNAYLAQNCLYSLKSPPVPATRDAVAFFLSESQQGACDMFASSMALLLRTMNVPARVVTGYLQPESPLSVAKNEGEKTRPSWIVRERDAHAWVEYYVPQIGWIACDPTASTRSAETLPHKIIRFLDRPGFDLPVATLLLPLAGCGLLVMAVCWPRLEKRLERQKMLQGDDLMRQNIVLSYQNARQRIARRVSFAPHLTPHQYEALVSRAPLPLAAKQEFAALTHLYIGARYGETPHVSRADVARCLKRLRVALKQKW